MKKNASDYVIALTVVLSSLVLLGAITVALSGFTFAKPKRTLEIDFANVAGIAVHSELRYAGAPAGCVKSMHTLTPEERAHLPKGHELAAVRLTVLVDDQVPAFGTDTSATISSDTLLGEKYVALTPGAPDAEPISEQTVLFGNSGLSIDNLAESLGPLLENANKTMADLRTQLNAVVPKLGIVLDSTKQTSDSAQTLVASANQLIKDNSMSIHARLEELGKVMADLQSLMASTNGTVANSNKLIQNSNELIDHVDARLDARMVELGVVLQNLKVITTYAKSLTETLARRPQALIFGGGKTPASLPSEQQILRSDKPISTRANSDAPHKRP